MNDKQPGSSEAKHLAHDALHDLVHFDTKLLRTLPALLFRPGKVTESTLAGESIYVKPFPLFIFCNFLFFVVKSKGLFHYTLDIYNRRLGAYIADKAAALHIPYNILAERFNMAMRFEQKEYLIIMVPLFALITHLLYFKMKGGFGRHLVFALNFYAFFICFMIILSYLFWPLAWSGMKWRGTAGFTDSELFILIPIFLVCFIYLAAALKRVYKQKWWLTRLKAGLLTGALLLLILVYREALFYIVMHAIGE